MHEALHRELYRGVIVWNRTRKRDQWGRQRQKDRDASEVLRVDAPTLRIVPEALWLQVHEGLARRRALYLESTGGKTHGRPLAGTVSRYLLTGSVTCGCCQGTLVVRTRAHGRRRDARLECWHYRTRGRRGCWNRYQPSMQALEALVLDAVESEILRPEVVERAIGYATAALAAPGDDAQPDVAGELATLDAEMARLAEVAATAGPGIGAIAEALRTRQERRTRLLRRQAAAVATARPSVPQTALRARLEDWRGMLRRNVAEARPVLDLLLADRIVVTPRREREGDEVTAFDVRLSLTTRGILAGIALPQGMASPTGFEPVF